MVRAQTLGSPAPNASLTPPLNAGKRMFGGRGGNPSTRWGGGDSERPFLPRAFSFLRHDAGRLEFLLEAIGPGTRRLAELEPGDGLLLLGPLGVGFEQPRMVDDRQQDQGFARRQGGAETAHDRARGEARTARPGDFAKPGLSRTRCGAPVLVPARAIAAKATAAVRRRARCQ